MRLGVIPRRHYVPHVNGCAPGYACPSRSDGLENSGYNSRRWFRDDGQRFGASSADTLEKWFGTGSADALEERFGTGSADTLEERIGTCTADTLVRTSFDAG